jgi:hypothetical protein
VQRPVQTREPIIKLLTVREILHQEHLRKKAVRKFGYMPELSPDPTEWQLEDFVAAHFVSRGCYVETGVKERSPDELLELDLVWTDYRLEPEVRHPVEVKSGDWGLGEVFKFFGWTKYLGLQPGQFVHRTACGRVKPETLKHVQTRTGTRLVHIPKPDAAEGHFKKLGLPAPHWAELPELWRFSFWMQRRLLRCIPVAIREGVSPHCARAAKNYHQLINDAVFFIPDVRARVGELLSAHFGHQKLARSCACELETGNVELDDPPDTRTFKRALFQGESFLVQACLYLSHRARLYILKAVVDYWLARERGEVKVTRLKFGDMLIELSAGNLTKAMAAGIEELSTAKSFRVFPLFWQVFLWSWGGFLLADRLEAEYELLARETGVPPGEIPLALQAFDRLFPTSNGWFREPTGDSRKVLMLMPAAMRGIGAFRRTLHEGGKAYSDLGYKDNTGYRMHSDHNCGARLLECEDADLVA